MANPEEIIAALAKLDANEDAHWTKGGAPQVKVIEELLGEAITREDINAVAPDFTRVTRRSDSPDGDGSDDNSELDTKSVLRAAMAEIDGQIKVLQAKRNAVVIELDEVLRSEAATRESVTHAQLVQDLMSKRDAREQESVAGQSSMADAVKALIAGQ